MKRIFFTILVVMIGTASLQAQAGKGEKKAVSPTSAKTTQAKTKAVQADTVTLLTTGMYQAYGSGTSRLSIADPIVNIFNKRANNAPVTFNGKSIIGMPGSTYGIANGRILLRTTTATSPGTLYGSGAVGTGTTLLGLGTSENAISINGKSPYAGPWLWGSKLPNRNLASFLPDSTIHRR